MHFCCVWKCQIFDRGKIEIGKIRVGILLYTKNFFQNFQKSDWLGEGNTKPIFFPPNGVNVYMVRNCIPQVAFVINISISSFYKLKVPGPKFGKMNFLLNLQIRSLFKPIHHPRWKNYKFLSPVKVIIENKAYVIYCF